MDGDQNQGQVFQALDFVSKTEIAFSACVVGKSPDGTFSTSCLKKGEGIELLSPLFMRDLIYDA
ncbi:hypothetical protein HTZ97_06130 [Desulfuromonas acetoxidans]|uniref:hypothetical protein n=1 Tax=Desulfuromonas acetoxidans TaxID=891 RepID=UPI00058D0BF7|nr:hypothetical protein [Desulfuromonas acetoxidans]MBF0644382.1 hypothetical protein [Desulfuromonas acetoxidans]NVD23576.1 hypothetical protein [Desulfuromonas acetoxidans]NVE16039.1 hypothetical protein [Desulfuromonas acetoxidans]